MDSCSELTLSIPNLLSKVHPDRRSCEFNKRPFYCITKSTVTLKKLEDYLVDFKQKVLQQEWKFKERTEAKLQKYNERELVSPHHVDLEPISSGTELEVFQEEQHSLFTLEEENDEETDANTLEVEYKQIHQIPKHLIDMLHNVKSLLLRLDEDCVKTKELLFKEKERTAKLSEKIDWHAYKRIHNLRRAVQREHEKCAYDIQELKWHCAYEGRKATRLKERVRVAENINKRIMEEIEFVEESSPLLSEKQNAEKESMKFIQEKQDKADILLKDARVKLDSKECSFEQAKRQADQEEKFLAQRLLSLSNELKNAQEKFLESQEIYSQMFETISAVQDKSAESELKDKELNINLVKIKQKQRNLELEIESLEIKIQSESSEYEILVVQNDELEEVRSNKETELDVMKRGFDFTIQEKTKDLQRVLKCNKTSQKEIHNLRRRMEASEKQKTADIKAVKRALDEREKVSSELEVIREETEENRTIHHKLLLALDQEREKAIEVEDSMSMQVEALKKSNKEENHARVILQARINAESSDLVKRKEESEKRKYKLTKAKEDVLDIVSTINNQVEKLDVKHKERVEALEALNKLLGQLSDKHSEMEKGWNNKIEELTPIELQLKESLSDLGSKVKEMDDISQTLNKKLSDMASSSIMMNRLLLSNQNAIQELNDEIAELQIQLDSGQGLEMTLRQSLSSVQERSKCQHEKHSTLKEGREKTLIRLKEEVVTALNENQTVAEEYIQLQSQHMNRKNQFLSSYEKSLIAQEKLSDKENLCELHGRLHEALKCYYQLRGIQTKATLSRFERMAFQSNVKLQNVQTSLEVATKNVSAFLKANNATHPHIKAVSRPFVQFSV